MQGLIASGHSASEAAELAGSTDAPAEPGLPAVGADAATRLRVALERFDDTAANRVLDDAIATLSVEALLEQVVLPCMRAIGERWEAGAVSVAQEHFATNVVRGRLMAIARNWGAGQGPAALLACPPGEQHDLGLLAFGVVLRERGWRVVYLGPDTPIETIEEAAELSRPAAVVLATTGQESVDEGEGALRALAARHRLLVGGGAAAAALAERVGAESLDSDPVRAALTLAAG
jgi:methanogenic corrinoid protein MtbC1